MPKSEFKPVKISAINIIPIKDKITQNNFNKVKRSFKNIGDAISDKDRSILNEILEYTGAKEYELLLGGRARGFEANYYLITKS